MGTIYKQLSIAERRRIELWRHAKVSVDEMARVSGAAGRPSFVSCGAIIFQMRACQNTMATMILT